jgi:RimJ/RimL family protein N-acetyltransferase
MDPMGRILVTVFVHRGRRFRIISSRNASRTERRNYESSRRGTIFRSHRLAGIRNKGPTVASTNSGSASAACRTARSDPPFGRMIVPVLDSARLRLRQYRSGDLEEFSALNSDPDVRKHVGGTLSSWRICEYLKDFAAGSDPGDIRCWAIETTQNGRYVGHAWLLHEGRPYQPDAGVLISRQHWGNRYGPEALRAVLQFAERELRFPHVYASVDTDNLRSASMLRRAGFVFFRKATDDEGDFHIFISQ